MTTTNSATQYAWLLTRRKRSRRNGAKGQLRCACCRKPLGSRDYMLVRRTLDGHRLVCCGDGVCLMKFYGLREEP
jgi:hypothetical protein